MPNPCGQGEVRAPRVRGEVRVPRIHGATERIVGEELKRRRWNKSSLSGRRKSDAEKVKIALRLRRENIMTLKWIAQRLKMGSWTNVRSAGALKRSSIWLPSRI